MINPEYILRQCKVERIVDGDTLDVWVDCGFSIWHKVRLRIAKYNAAEIGTPEGLAARDALARHCPVGSYVGIYTRRVDKYGRYLALDLIKAGDPGLDVSVIKRLVAEGHLKEVS